MQISCVDICCEDVCQRLKEVVAPLQGIYVRLRSKRCSDIDRALHNESGDTVAVKGTVFNLSLELLFTIVACLVAKCPGANLR